MDQQQEPPPSCLFVSFDPKLYDLQKMGDAPQEQACYLKTTGWLFEAETKQGDLTRTPTLNHISFFQSGIPTLETTQKA